MWNKNNRIYLAAVQQSTWTFACKKKKKNEIQRTSTQSRVFRKTVFIFTLFSHHSSVSRFVSLPHSQRTRCVQLYHTCEYIQPSHFTSRTIVGSATFLEPCSQFCLILVLFFGKYLKEVSSGVELKMVHVLAYLTMQFR